MRRLIALLFLGILASFANAGGPTGKVVLDNWDIVYLGEGKAGHIHTLAKEFEADGKTLVQTTVELRITVKRFKEIAEMAMDTGTTETSDGTVTGTFMKQYLAK